MINMDTLWLISRLNQLALYEPENILPFSKATFENKSYSLFYDDSEVYDNYGDGYVAYRIVLDSVVDPIHHDIVSLDENELWTAVVVVNEEDESIPLDVNIRFNFTDEIAAVSNGTWFLT